MNRLHVHVSVEDLERSIRFYKTLLGAEPTVLKHDYAKWRLDEPAVNFAISARTGAVPGIEHLGIEASSHERLTAITERLKAAEESTFGQEATTCCYAVSDKSWVEDPSGVRWETFFTHGESATYGVDASIEGLESKTPKQTTSGCC
mgnify:CR=1 FL=1